MARKKKTVTPEEINNETVGIGKNGSPETSIPSNEETNEVVEDVIEDVGGGSPGTSTPTGIRDKICRLSWVHMVIK